MSHQTRLPPPPIRNKANDRSWIGPDGYFARLQKRVDEENQIDWAQIDTTDALHSDLGGVGTNTHTQIDTHVDNTNLDTHGSTIAATITFAELANMSLGATTGTKLGTTTTEKLGIWGATPIVRPTALTTALTTVTYTTPGTPDYALQDLIDSGAGSAWGFATQDEGNSLLSVVANLQTRINELETKLKAVGVIA